MPESSIEPLLQVSELHKSYGSVEVLHGVSFEMFPGEILGIIGENGAGKSTLMKCLNGISPHTSGNIRFNGIPFQPKHPADAIRGGIITIPQEFNLVNDLNIYENIFLGQEKRGRFGLLDKAFMRQRAAELLEELNADLNVDALVADLSVAAKQLVEIAKALATTRPATVEESAPKGCLLIMDEPTTVLNQHEVHTLFKTVRKLQAAGTSIIFISHKLKEVLEICDKVAVLRDGNLVSFTGVEGLDEAELARRMVGRPLSQMFSEKAISSPNAETALEVSHLEVEGVLHDISFELRRGEVLGFAGLVGAGRTELAETLYGIRQPSSGVVKIFGKETHIRTPRQALSEGLAYLPEDRQGTGILTSFPLAANVTLSSLERYCHPFISTKEENAQANQYIDHFHIKSNGTDTLLCDLSGGNQQKVAIAKGLDTKPRIFIFDEPTRGIDIQAKSEVYAFIRSLLEQGLACILISSDLEEVIGICRRVAVMRDGRIAGFLQDDDISEERIMYLASGVSAAT